VIKPHERKTQADFKEEQEEEDELFIQKSEENAFVHYVLFVICGRLCLSARQWFSQITPDGLVSLGEVSLQHRLRK